MSEYVAYEPMFRDLASEWAIGALEYLPRGIMGEWCLALVTAAASGRRWVVEAAVAERVLSWARQTPGWYYGSQELFAKVEQQK